MPSLSSSSFHLRRRRPLVATAFDPTDRRRWSTNARSRSSITTTTTASTRLVVGTTAKNDDGARLPRWSSTRNFAPPPPISRVDECDAADAIPRRTTTARHVPPLPVRVCLVSATTALATPAFPVLGLLYLALRVSLPDPSVRKAMEGKWGALISFATWTALPAMYGGGVSSLILPCAIGNALIAGGAYCAADLACGVGPSSRGGREEGGGGNAASLMGRPFLLGSGIGAIVGYVGPKHAYGPLMEIMYGMDGMSASLGMLLDVPHVAEVCVITGALSGTILHPLLYVPVNGVPGYHWGYLSGTALLAIAAASFYVYRGRADARLPVPEGSYVDPSMRDVVDSILRYDVSSGEVRTYSLHKMEYVGPPDKCEEGRRIASVCRSYITGGSSSDWVKWWGGGLSSEQRRVVFDDRVLAFAYNYWDVDTRARYPERIVNVRDETELRSTQNIAATTDAAVTYILRKNEMSDDADRTATGIASATTDGGNDAMKALAVIHELNSTNDGRKLTPSRIQQFEDVSSAVELLMIMKRSNDGESRDDVLVETLERFVRTRFPELILYSADERYRGMSVESQLQMSHWRGRDLPNAMDRWKSIQEREARRIRMNRTLLVVSGILLSIAGSVLRANE